jgi:hypothetical protein
MDFSLRHRGYRGLSAGRFRKLLCSHLVYSANDGGVIVRVELGFLAQVLCARCDKLLFGHVALRLLCRWVLLNHNNISLSTRFCITYTCGMEQPKNKGGRPPIHEDQRLVQRSIRLPPDLWAKIDAHGLEWLRAVIRRARPPAG